MLRKLSSGKLGGGSSRRSKTDVVSEDADTTAMEILYRASTSSTRIELELVRSPGGFGVGLSDLKIQEAKSPGSRRGSSSGQALDYNRVTALADSGIAARAGMQLFDRVVAVDGESTAARPAAPLIAGKETIQLSIDRPELSKEELAELTEMLQRKGSSHEKTAEAAHEMEKPSSRRMSGTI